MDPTTAAATAALTTTMPTMSVPTVSAAPAARPAPAAGPHTPLHPRVSLCATKRPAPGSACTPAPISRRNRPPRCISRPEFDRPFENRVQIRRFARLLSCADETLVFGLTFCSALFCSVLLWLPVPPPRPRVSLCPLCGMAMEAGGNAANICGTCLSNNVDVTEGIPKQVIIYQCRGCDRSVHPSVSRQWGVGCGVYWALTAGVGGGAGVALHLFSSVCVSECVSPWKCLHFCVCCFVSLPLSSSGSTSVWPWGAVTDHAALRRCACTCIHLHSA